MPDKEKYIKILSKAEKTVKEYNEDAPIKISLECVEDILELLKEQEAVVRCKDCKWWDKKDDSNYGYCHACKHGYNSDHWEIGIYRTYKGNWFCADGERKVRFKAVTDGV